MKGKIYFSQSLVVFLTIQSLCYRKANARVISKDVNDEDNTVEINLNINLDPNDADDFVDAPVKDVSSDLVEIARATTTRAPIGVPRTLIKQNQTKNGTPIAEQIEAFYQYLNWCRITPWCDTWE